MATTFAGTLEINAKATKKNVDFNGVSGRSPVDKIKDSASLEWANGTAADQADKEYQIEGTIAGGGTVDLDLAGTLTDANGATITLARIKFFMLRNTSVSPNTAADIKVGPGPSNGVCPWLGGTTPFETVPVTGVVARGRTDATGWSGITAGSADILRLTNLHGSQVASYKLTLWGSSS